MRGGMQRHAAPAGADFEQMIARLQFKPAADTVKLGDRGLFERHAGPFEQRRRIHHRRIEKDAEKIVAQIIVRSDVALTSAPAVACRPVQRLAQGRAEPRQTALHAVDHAHVADHHAHHCRQIVAAPVARHIRFAGADRTTERDVGIKARIVYAHRDRKRATRCHRAELHGFAALFKAQRAVFERGKARQHGATGQGFERLAGRRGARGCCGFNHGAFHGLPATVWVGVCAGCV